MSMNISELKTKAQFIRRTIFEMIVSANKGHVGGAFSCTDILVALYHGGVLKYDSQDIGWEQRDRFILSKGHSCEALYVVLADLGFFPEEELQKYQKGNDLGGHPDPRVQGVEAETGSLGHGLGLAAGRALSAKMDQKDFLSVVLLGDGECCEGSVWEAALFASKRKLDNLIGIVDYNELCSTDRLEDCTAMAPLAQKWEAFGWDVTIVDGHSFEELLGAFAEIRGRNTQKPLMIVAKTVKGKGVSFMENNVAWHHGLPKGDQIEQARKELSGEA